MLQSDAPHPNASPNKSYVTFYFTNAFVIKQALLGSDASDVVFHCTRVAQNAKHRNPECRMQVTGIVKRETTEESEWNVISCVVSRTLYCIICYCIYIFQCGLSKNLKVHVREAENNQCPGKDKLKRKCLSIRRKAARVWHCAGKEATWACYWQHGNAFMIQYDTINYIYSRHVQWFAFSALTLLVGRQEGHPACCTGVSSANTWCSCAKEGFLWNWVDRE